MNRKFLIWALLVVCPGSTLVSNVLAQVITSTVTGRLVDPTDALVVGATITLTETATQATHEQKTSKDGLFWFPQLTAGTYDLKIVSEGFESYERTGMVVNATSELGLGTIKMSVGRSSVTVVVQSDTVILDKASPNTDSTLGRQDLEEISMRSHDIMEAITLLPGMVDDAAGARDAPNSNSAANVYTNGIRSSKNIMIDGQSSMDPGGGAPRLRDTIPAPAIPPPSKATDCMDP